MAAFCNLSFWSCNPRQNNRCPKNYTIRYGSRLRVKSKWKEIYVHRRICQLDWAKDRKHQIARRVLVSSFVKQIMRIEQLYRAVFCKGMAILIDSCHSNDSNISYFPASSMTCIAEESIPQILYVLYSISSMSCIAEGSIPQIFYVLYYLSYMPCIAEGCIPQIIVIRLAVLQKGYKPLNRWFLLHSASPMSFLAEGRIPRIF